MLRGDHSLHGAAQYLRRIVAGGRMPRVVVLLGAGVSTSAGIKDFRSAAGLYADKSVSRIFHADFFHDRPREFYDILLREMGPLLQGPPPRPTAAHWLLRLLRDAGWLTRVYTQNIDHLERAVGLPAGDIVECHGSLFRTLCPACSLRNEDPAAVQAFWDNIAAQGTPKCPCGGTLRPDIVLFGEPLPGRFHQLAYTDCAGCDLLLVMGTSLVVYPVAALPSFVPATAVRMLFNRESTGCFQGLSPCNGPDSGVADPARDTGAHYRDLYHEGDCDSAARAFVDELGLASALSGLLST